MGPLWTWLIDHLSAEVRLITGAPVLFVLALVIIGGGVALIARYTFSVQIANLNSIVSLKDAQVADYKDKLSGATPDQAKERLDALERQVARLAARRLTQPQRERICSTLLNSASNNATVICVMYDMSVPDAAAYAADITAAFDCGGWSVQTSAVLGVGSPAPCGLAIRIATSAVLAQPPYQYILLAFERAEVEYTLQRPNEVHGPGVADILITMRVT